MARYADFSEDVAAVLASGILILIVNVRNSDFSTNKLYTRTARLYDLGVKVLPVWKTWLKRALPYIQGRRGLGGVFWNGISTDAVCR